MRRALAAVVLLLPGCTTPPIDVPDPPVPTSLARCVGPSPATVPPVVAAMSVPGSWVRVDEIFRGRGDVEVVETKAYHGRYAVLGGDSTLPPRVDVLHMPNSTAEAIERAIEHGATVTVHTGGNGRPREVAYALAERNNDVAFVGECAAVLFDRPLRAHLGNEFGRVLPGLVGRAPRDVERILTASPEEAAYLIRDPDGLVIDSATPRSLLAAYRQGWFTVRETPPSWDGNARLCTVVALGRAGCVGLRGESTNVTRVRLWYDPRDPTVRVVLREVPLHRQVAVLGTVDVAAEARKAGFDPEADGVQLWVELAPSPSLADVLADPALASRALRVTRVAPCTVRSC